MREIDQLCTAHKVPANLYASRLVDGRRLCFASRRNVQINYAGSAGALFTLESEPTASFIRMYHGPTSERENRSSRVLLRMCARGLRRY